ncbi:MAG: hypothetical protein RMJ87_04005 [Cytophagales bacterium]|nr:hypothetical protein [Bernardetiaceae bacterium]MDW8204172.1 hypothetical protein [Cytophagales bacterium]
MRNLLFSVMAMAACLLACGPSEKEQQQLAEAMQYHQQAMEYEKQTMALLKQVKQAVPLWQSRADSLSKAGADSLAASMRSWLAEAEQVEKALQEWGKTVVEVPGYEHDHSHDKEGEAHHHAHERIETTPEQMIAIQKDLRDKVEAIKNRAQELVNQIK